MIVAEFDIDISPYHPNANIGQIFRNHDDLRRYLDLDVPGYECSILVCNENMFGNFSIPVALGFSTPLTLLSGASLRLLQGDATTDIRPQLRKWDKIFGGVGIRKSTRSKFCSDKKECSICVEPYRLGEEITNLCRCGHQFHYLCAARWKNAQQPEKGVVASLIRAVLQEIPTFPCPLCGEPSTL